MLGMSYFIRSRSSIQNSAFVCEIEKTIKANQKTMESIQDWRNTEIKYIGQLMQIQSKIRDRMEQSILKSDAEFLSLLQTVVRTHKNLITKINQEIFDYAYPKLCKIINQQKQILNQQKGQNKHLTCKRQQLNKLKQKQKKLKKNLAQQLTHQIFNRNSMVESENQIKIMQRVEQIQRQQDQHDQKIKQVKQLYSPIVQKSKQNLTRFDQCQQNFINQTMQMLSKTRNNIQNFGQCLSFDIQDSKSSITLSLSSQIENQPILQKFKTQQQFLLHSCTGCCKGYLQTTIEIIKNNSIDEIIECSKNNQMKKKIKQIIQSNDDNTSETVDQVANQVQTVKKILKTGDITLLQQLKCAMSQSSKTRMNFVFMLQLYRINNKFQITQDQISPIFALISQLLQISHQKKDAFVIKQVIILLLTYYINVKDNDENQRKVYILYLFKKYQFWKDLQLWQSILIQNIYTEKKATIRTLLTNSFISNKSQFLQAEKSSILNQILYVVKNMILFDISEKQVKQFACKFVKILKQDDKFLKDVNKSIDNAIKEQKQNKSPDNLTIEKLEISKISVDQS